MRVQFLKDTSKARIPDEVTNGNTLVVYRDGYRLPKIANAVYLDFEKYKVSYPNYKPDYIVVVGLNRILVPSVRCELVFEYLQTMSNHITKYSIDTSPFIGEPWRLWFHYSVAYGSWLDFNYSYVVETDWSHWFYQDTESSVIAARNIKGKLLETYSDLDKLSTTFEFYDPDPMLVQYYNQVKEFAFNKYGTPKQIITLMLRELNKHLGVSIGYDSYLSNEEIKVPDFGVFQFMVEENNRRMEIYNTVIV